MADNDLDFNSIVELIKKQEKKENDKRKKSDWVTQMPMVLSYISAFVVVIVWGILSYVGPRLGTDWAWLTMFGDFSPPQFTWPKVPVNVAYVMLIASMVMCVIAFIFNRMRMKRKGDKYKVSVFFIGSVALVTFVVFLVYFLPRGILGFF